MSDIFSRLFKESVDRKDERTQKMREAIKTEEDEKWKLKLAASCHLVDRNTNPTQKQQRREVMSSLSTISLHHKKPTQKTEKRKAQSILSQNRRSVSTIMDKQGSIKRTNNYIITDSVEPPPYRYLKPTPNSSRRYYDKNETPRTKRVDTQGIKQQIEKNKLERLEWGQLDSICTTKIDVDNADEMEREISDDNIMVDINEELPLDVLPKATNLISKTGICFEMYGYPDALSFILDPK
jgi:hypothetical protein